MLRLYCRSKKEEGRRKKAISYLGDECGECGECGEMGRFVYLYNFLYFI
ncbi:MAG: hypothetical protein F6K23_29390 [Okeania sp. SIO2C9]|nr:hypothetical protein [Okeania sp. SIO2C9]NEQ76775.1 hypothetical protein [Okeania sp. SIO2C9]